MTQRGDRQMRWAEDVAMYIIAEGVRIKRPVNNLQLQKILYYIQVHFLKKTGIEFFADNVEAWQFGPVVPKSYYKYAVFGPAPLTMFSVPKIDLTNEERVDIDRIIEEKAVLSPWDMMTDTQQKDKAWNMYYQTNERNVIPKNAMKLYG